MLLPDQIREKTEQIIENTEFFLVEVKNTSTGIAVLIDTDTGITLQQCGDVHKQLFKHFEQALENTNLQISSPGLTAPLKVVRQYTKNIGRNLQIIKTDGTQTNGKILETTPETLKLELNTKQKEIEKIPFAQIKKAKLVI